MPEMARSRLAFGTNGVIAGPAVRYFWDLLVTIKSTEWKR
jgi:hypothetical protein